MKPFKIDGMKVNKENFKFIGQIHKSTKKRETRLWRLIVDKKDKAYEVEQTPQGRIIIHRKTKDVIAW